jgi:hypothetical protein
VGFYLKPMNLKSLQSAPNIFLPARPLFVFLVVGSSKLTCAVSFFGFCYSDMVAVYIPKVASLPDEEWPSGILPKTYEPKISSIRS